MISGYKFGSCLATFANCADRYCREGYGGGANDIEKMLDMACSVEDIDGLELVGNWHVNDDNIFKVGDMFKKRNLEICMLVPDLWTQAKWGKGSFASTDKKIRQQAVAEVKKVMDWAAQLNCPYVDVWLGQDGYDYSMQEIGRASCRERV